MPVTCVVGAQWGDEAKGKITDILAEDAAIVMRYQGGPNAGHTVAVGEEVFKFHLIPSGILRPSVTCIMADGTVIDPIELDREIADLKSRGVDCENLLVSGNAHVIMPYHRLLDGLAEDASGKGKIGTTRRGIGPVYADKLARVPRGIRMWDLMDDDTFRSRAMAQLEYKNKILRCVYGHEGMTPEESIDPILEVAPRLRRYIADIRPIVRQALATDASIILEGAQGTYIDPDYGTYPYVTSSHPVAGGACLGTGIPPMAISRLVLVAKAYTTRVGGGPFPTELTDKMGERLREAGGEYGTTTGRPRRCGWFDAVLVRGAVQVNGATELAITKLDVLDGLDRVNICVGYRLHGQVLEYPPGNLDLLDEVEPVYEELPGWKESTRGVTSYSELPAKARAYIERIEELAGAPVRMVSTGPARDEILLRS
ncbi:MAG: adenylosuccinate synthase [Armatimonadetes bacterium]|nr:adenylosuccinate synthase [Armatimonadota bacterium]